MKTFEQYQEEKIGECYRNDKAFLNKENTICYVPENAEDINDCFNYSDLKNQVLHFLEENKNYLEDNDTNVEELLTNMYENLHWEFPSTFLDSLDY